jgi:hypothetical protein
MKKIRKDEYKLAKLKIQLEVMACMGNKEITSDQLFRILGEIKSDVLYELINAPAEEPEGPEREFYICSKEGYTIYHGRMRATGFQQACDKFAMENNEFARHYDEKNLTYWESQLFSYEGVPAQIGKKELEITFDKFKTDAS